MANPFLRDLPQPGSNMFDVTFTLVTHCRCQVTIVFLLGSVVACSLMGEYEACMLYGVWTCVCCRWWRMSCFRVTSTTGGCDVFWAPSSINRLLHTQTKCSLCRYFHAYATRHVCIDVHMDACLYALQMLTAGVHSVLRSSVPCTYLLCG